VLNDVRDLPVKIFINCKNTKKKANSNFVWPVQLQNSSEYDPVAANFDLVTREEVFFTGRENIDGFVCLVNVFTKQLACNTDHVALINVDNYDINMQRTDIGLR